MRMFEEPEFIGGGIMYRHEEKERIMRDPELREAYMCGRKEAYKEIMEEQYGERNYGGGGNYSQRGNYRDDYEDYNERRRRRSNGQFY